MVLLQMSAIILLNCREPRFPKIGCKGLHPSWTVGTDYDSAEYVIMWNALSYTLGDFCSVIL